jgi:hypothetical protein
LSSNRSIAQLETNSLCRNKKTAWSLRIGHPTDLLTPRGLGLRFRWPSRNPASQENELFHPESQGIRLKPSSFLAVGIQGNTKAVVVVVAVRRVVPVPVRRPTIRGLVVSTAATVHAVRALKVRPPH